LYGVLFNFVLFLSMNAAFKIAVRMKTETMKKNGMLNSQLIKPNRQKSILERALRQKELMIIGIGFLVYIVIFFYVPLWYWLAAFTDYNPGLGVTGSEWVGFKHFRNLLRLPQFWRVFRNTFAMSSLSMVFGTVAAIVLAIALNETRAKGFKRTVQTFSYLPHFVSWVVAANIILNILSIHNGLVNQILLKLGIIDRPQMWIGKPQWFWIIIALSNTWKSMGWSSIVYLAAIAGIEPQYYEAAAIDGAGRLRRIWHVTLPGILPTFTVLLILNLGYLFRSGFEQQLLLGNPLVNDVSEVISIFVLRYGLVYGRFAFSIAAGIFNSIVSIIMIVSANFVIKRADMEYLF
jgi:putative aldouronate transport system permease protein